MYLSWNCITTIIVYVLQCYDIEIKEYKSLDNAIFRIYVHSFANRVERFLGIKCSHPI